MLTLSNASLAAGIAWGTIVGYTLNCSSGDLLNNALITTSCGVSRAAGKVIFQDPLTHQIMCGVNLTDDAQTASEMNDLAEKHKIFHALYQVNLGFGLGVALGSSTSETSLLTGALNGFLIYTAGFCAEIIPVLAFSKPLQVIFDENGHRIS